MRANFHPLYIFPCSQKVENYALVARNAFHYKVAFYIRSCQNELSAIQHEYESMLFALGILSDYCMPPHIMALPLLPSQQPTLQRSFIHSHG